MPSVSVTGTLDSPKKDDIYITVNNSFRFCILLRTLKLLFFVICECCIYN
jgi:hypothetical protein